MRITLGHLSIGDLYMLWSDTVYRVVEHGDVEQGGLMLISQESAGELAGKMYRVPSTARVIPLSFENALARIEE